MTVTACVHLPTRPAQLPGSCLYSLQSFADLPTLQNTMALGHLYTQQTHPPPTIPLVGQRIPPGQRCWWPRPEGQVDGDTPAVPWGTLWAPAGCLSHLSPTAAGSRAPEWF